MDICELILSDHHEQRRMFAMLDDVAKDDTRTLGVLWKRLSTMLEVHAQGEEELFYPELLKLGERLQVHRTSVTNIVDKLEQDGFVRRVPHESDRRATLAEITPEGRAVGQAATLDMNAAAFSLEALQAGEQEQLTTLLEAVRRGAGDFED